MFSLHWYSLNRIILINYLFDHCLVHVELLSLVSVSSVVRTVWCVACERVCECVSVWWCGGSNG